MVGCSPSASELWKKTPWRKLRRNLFRLQMRVYKAIRAGDKRKAKSLQKLILKSLAAKCGQKDSRSRRKSLSKFLREDKPESMAQRPLQRLVTPEVTGNPNPQEGWNPNPKSPYHRG